MIDNPCTPCRFSSFEAPSFTTVSLTISYLTASASTAANVSAPAAASSGAVVCRSDSAYLLIAPVRAGSRAGRARLFAVGSYSTSVGRQRVDVCVRAFLAEIGNRATHVLFAHGAAAAAPLKIDAEMLISTGCRRYATPPIRTRTVRGRRMLTSTAACVAWHAGRFLRRYYAQDLSIDLAHVYADSHSRLIRSSLVLFRCTRRGRPLDSDR